MQTYPQCFSCLDAMVKTASRTSCGSDSVLEAACESAWQEYRAQADPRLSPPDHAGNVFAMLREITGVDDPYAEDKRLANEHAMALLPKLRAMLDEVDDPLALALRFSIIGNYIDSGANLDVDWRAALLNEDGNGLESSVRTFASAARPGAQVIILGDNTGEIALDTLLVELLLARGCRVCYAVRDRAVLNDATLEDAKAVGMDRLCEVVSTGSDAPATILHRISASFLDRMRQTDVLLSKGQGNFEALHNEWPSAFFAFKCKCDVIKNVVGKPVGTSILMCPKP